MASRSKRKLFVELFGSFSVGVVCLFGGVKSANVVPNSVAANDGYKSTISFYNTSRKGVFSSPVSSVLTVLSVGAESEVDPPIVVGVTIPMVDLCFGWEALSVKLVDYSVSVEPVQFSSDADAHHHPLRTPISTEQLTTCFCFRLTAIPFSHSSAINEVAQGPFFPYQLSGSRIVGEASAKKFFRREEVHSFGVFPPSFLVPEYCYRENCFASTGWWVFSCKSMPIAHDGTATYTSACPVQACAFSVRLIGNPLNGESAKLFVRQIYSTFLAIDSDKRDNIYILGLRHKRHSAWSSSGVLALSSLVPRAYLIPFDQEVNV